MDIEKREEIIELYDTYGCLLTEKQSTYFEEYYFEDLSISEIAMNHNISRNAIFDQLKRVNQILKDYEEKLKLVSKASRIEEIQMPQNIKEEIMNIIKE
ncbi:MAG: helix-turn-helix domain-containing protein [Anaeroplasmataceae bacterium]|nr:helix-turn-helix domain-containing protein [Anaeroplasmataceae bacterium]